MDRFALRSHQRLLRAREAGLLEEEMVPLYDSSGKVHEQDTGPRPDTSLEALAKLRPAFKEDGRVTAATSSQITDGAAAVLMSTGAKAKEMG